MIQVLLSPVVEDLHSFILNDRKWCANTRFNKRLPWVRCETTPNHHNKLLSFQSSKSTYILVLAVIYGGIIEPSMHVISTCVQCSPVLRALYWLSALRLYCYEIYSVVLKVFQNLFIVFICAWMKVRTRLRWCLSSPGTSQCSAFLDCHSHSLSLPHLWDQIIPINASISEITLCLMYMEPRWNQNYQLA